MCWNLVFYKESHGYINFRQTVKGEIPRFNFDLKQMKRVLINLLENSIAVLPEGGDIEIVLSLNRENGVVLMEVKDNGPGVTDEDKHRLFEPYFSTKPGGIFRPAVVMDHDIQRFDIRCPFQGQFQQLGILFPLVGSFAMRRLSGDKNHLSNLRLRHSFARANGKNDTQ